MKAALTLFLTNIALLSAFAEEPDHWRFDGSLNLFLAGMTGEVAAKGIPTSVNASFSDIFEHLEAGVAGRFTVGYDRWFASTEFSYLRLSASPPKAELELEQWLVEPSIGYTFCKYVDGFVGARYNNVGGDVTFNGPLGRVPAGTHDWWDPIVGTQLRFPLFRNKLSFDGRFDVGGFGVGSDFTWQAFPHLNWRFAKWGSAQAGYRWLGTDYESGSGTSRFRYDVILQGPQLGVSFNF